MRSVLKIVLTLPFALAIAGAQTHQPRGTATDVGNADIQATVQKTASAVVSDQAIRVVSINGEYNVGIGVVHRAKTAGRSAGGGIEHSQITEVYHFIEGNGTLVTGGTIENPKESAPDGVVVKVLNGPSTGGGPVQDGVSRKVGPGDVVIIPPNTPHWFSEIVSDQIVYLVVRVTLIRCCRPVMGPSKAALPARHAQGSSRTSRSPCSTASRCSGDRSPILPSSRSFASART